MQLERPIVVLDLETTGTDPVKDRIVQIGLIGIYPDGQTQELMELVNPLIPIPAAAIECHGITDEMVRDAKPFSLLAPSIWNILVDVDFCGFNCISFDLPMLTAEFGRVGMKFNWEDKYIVDVMKIFHKMEPRNLSSALKKYVGRDHENAHSALEDARATRDVLGGMMVVYNLPKSVKELAEFSLPEGFYDLEGKLIRKGEDLAIAFGKHYGTLLKDVPADYLVWMINSDFKDKVKSALRTELTRRGI